MLYVYIILGTIIVLFITVVILAIRKYNNEEVSKELEYVSENFEVEDVEIDQPQEEVKEPAKPVEEKKVEVQTPVVQTPVDNTPPPVINLKVGEQTDEEIAIVDTAIKEEATSESVEIKDNALKTEETGDEVKIEDTSLKVEEEGDAAVVIPDSTVNPTQIEKVEIPKDTTDYKNQAFNNTFDGNTTINKDIRVDSPKPKDINKTEIWDMSEVIKEVNSNEKN